MYCVLCCTTSTMLPETVPWLLRPVLSNWAVSSGVHRLRRLSARQFSTVSPARKYSPLPPSPVMVFSWKPTPRGVWQAPQWAQALYQVGTPVPLGSLLRLGLEGAFHPETPSSTAPGPSAG